MSWAWLALWAPVVGGCWCFHWWDVRRERLLDEAHEEFDESLRELKEAWNG